MTHLDFSLCNVGVHICYTVHNCVTTDIIIYVIAEEYFRPRLRVRAVGLKDGPS